MLKDCPFCKKSIEFEDIRKSGIFWRELKESEDFILRIYVHGKDITEDDNPCWKIECYEYKGGCGAYITADEKPEVIKKWNKRT